MLPLRAHGRELPKNLILLAASSCFCLSAAIGFLHLYLHLNPTVYQLDARCLYRLVPGAVKEFRHLRANGGGRVTVRINHAGFRGDELTQRGLVHRIVVYGDSFIEAETSPLEETFCKRLEALLGARLRGAPLEVVNAGVMGYGPDQVSVRLEQELRSLAPELVIVALYAGNDFGDLLRNKLYRLGPDGSLQEHRPTLSASLRGHLARSSEAERLDGGALRRLLVALYWRVNPRELAHEAGLPEQGAGEGYVAWSLRAARDEYSSYVLRGDPVVVNLLGDHYDADVALRPGSEAARYKVALMELVLRRIQQTLAASRTALLVLVIPCAIDVCPDRHVRGVQLELPESTRATLSRALAELAEHNGMAVLDLFEPFRAESSLAHLYYRDPEAHWNAAGQQLAARLAAATIVVSNLLDR